MSHIRPFSQQLAIQLGLLLLVVVGIFYVLMSGEIRKSTELVIEDNFDLASGSISRTITSNNQALTQIANSLKTNSLISDILNDVELDRETNDDIVNEEILQADSFGQGEGGIDVLAVFNAKGVLRALNRDGLFLEKKLGATPVVQDMLRIKNATGYVYTEKGLLQLVARYNAVGPPGQEELLGGVVVGKHLSQGWLIELKDVLRSDIALMANDNPNMGTPLSLLNGSVVTSEVAYPALLSNSTSLGKSDIMSAECEGERFLYRKVKAQDTTFPSYMIVRSLDAELKKAIGPLKQTSIYLAIVVLIAGIVMGVVLARQISKPIASLREGAKAIEAGHYEHRVAVNSKDEFLLLGDSFNQMATGLEEKEKMRGVMNKVVSKEIADELLVGDLVLGGEERTATILFSDVRSFSQLSEGLDAHALLEFLNKYLNEMAHCIDANKGNIDKFLGDAIMALFGVPVERSSHAVDAVEAGLDMVATLERFNTAVGGPMDKIMNMGIGINTGPLVAGMMGSENRMEYTVLGDEVNLASRFEGMTKQYRCNLVISSATHEALGADRERYHLRFLDDVRVVGKTQAVGMYEVLGRVSDGAASIDVLAFKKAHALLLAGDLSASQAAFQAIAQTNPGDGPTAMFLDRLAGYVADPTDYAADYEDGVFVAKKK